MLLFVVAFPAAPFLAFVSKLLQAARMDAYTRKTARPDQRSNEPPPPTPTSAVRTKTNRAPRHGNRSSSLAV